MNFAQALVELVQGRAIRRQCWSGDQVLFMAPTSSLLYPDEIEDYLGEACTKHLPTNQAVLTVPRLVARFRDEQGETWITDHTLTNIQLFADDWVVAS